MKKVLLLLVAALPALAVAQENKNETIVIKYDPNAALIDSFDEYYPEYHTIKQPEAPKTADVDLSNWEIVFTGGVNESIGNLHETNAQLHTAVFFHLNDDWALGLATGYYHSLGRYYTRNIPLLLMAHYTFNALPFGDFKPFFEVYGGELFGIYVSDRINDDDKAPTCPIVGLKLGLAYNLYDLSKFYPSLNGKHWLKHFTVQGSVNMMHVIDNDNSKNYGHTAETCIGAMAGLGYRF